MIDRDKLEEAVQVTRERAAKNGEVWWTIEPAYLALLADAAEAHLATLTKFKTVWHVSDVEGSVHYDTADEAYRALWPRMQHATSDVTIGSRKVQVA